MNIFSIINMAQSANPKADISIRNAGHNQILIIWNWDGQYLNRRYCKDSMTTHRYGEYEAWRIAFNAAAQIMGIVASVEG